MKIYTKAEDNGTTRLLSGESVLKSDPRPEACGVLDELNSAVGMVLAELGKEHSGPSDELRQAQTVLLRAGAAVAAMPGSPQAAGLKPVIQEDWSALECAMDRMSAGLPALSGFIRPGGCESTARVHVARTVCRRAERRVVALAQEDQTTAEALAPTMVFLNRFSDYLFVLARYFDHFNNPADDVRTLDSDEGTSKRKVDSPDRCPG